MAENYWGLLGAETVETTNRTRTLGLGTTVRAFNDLAVPNMGSIWFAKQLFLATLGVSVAEKVRQETTLNLSNIQIANAIEAIACWLAFEATNWNPDPRLRGINKLRHKDSFHFASVVKPHFYVSQPMRMSTVQALRALGLVTSTGERFNTFNCSKYGHTLIELVCANHKAHHNTIKDFLTKWVRGDKRSISVSGLHEALSPKKLMPAAARNFIRERLIAADLNYAHAERRKAALNWVELLRQKTQTPDWSSKPAAFTQTHWDDLKAGAVFFLLRNVAINTLDQVELQIAQQSNQQLDLNAKLPENILESLVTLKTQAQQFINLHYDPSPNQQASQFATECLTSNTSILKYLVQRDGRVLKQCDHYILPSVAFMGAGFTQQTGLHNESEDAGIETSPTLDEQWPEGISYRLPNLFRLNLDLHGVLDHWLINSTAIEPSTR